MTCSVSPATAVQPHPCISTTTQPAYARFMVVYCGNVAKTPGKVPRRLICVCRSVRLCALRCSWSSASGEASWVAVDSGELALQASCSACGSSTSSCRACRTLARLSGMPAGSSTTTDFAADPAFSSAQHHMKCLKGTQFEGCGIRTARFDVYPRPVLVARIGVRGATCVRSGIVEFSCLAGRVLHVHLDGALCFSCTGEPRCPSSVQVREVFRCRLPGACFACC